MSFLVLFLTKSWPCIPLPQVRVIKCETLRSGACVVGVGDADGPGVGVGRTAREMRFAAGFAGLASKASDTA